jgi:hypothetical protein
MKRIILVVIVIGVLAGINSIPSSHIIYVAEAEEPEVVLIETEEEKIERLIREEFKDAPIMVKVAKCESEFRNVKGMSSDDFGPFQINYVHLETLEEKGLDRTVIEDNIKFARILYTESGLKPWQNSKKCWSK